MEVNANEGGSTTTRGGIYWLILPAGCNAQSIYLPYTNQPFFRFRRSFVDGFK